MSDRRRRHGVDVGALDVAPAGSLRGSRRSAGALIFDRRGRCSRSIRPARSTGRSRGQIEADVRPLGGVRRETAGVRPPSSGAAGASTSCDRAAARRGMRFCSTAAPSTTTNWPDHARPRRSPSIGSRPRTKRRPSERARPPTRPRAAGVEHCVYLEDGRRPGVRRSRRRRQLALLGRAATTVSDARRARARGARPIGAPSARRIGAAAAWAPARTRVLTRVRPAPRPTGTAAAAVAGGPAVVDVRGHDGGPQERDGSQRAEQREPGARAEREGIPFGRRVQRRDSGTGTARGYASPRACSAPRARARRRPAETC